MEKVDIDMNAISQFSEHRNYNIHEYNPRSKSLVLIIYQAYR